jgi:hypothetical protein
MRKPPLGATTRHRVIPCVLLIGADEGVTSLVRRCAALAVSARLEITDVESMGTRAAEWRPFAILVQTSLLEFAPEEFIAVARSVGARLVTLPDERLDDPRFKTELTTTLRAIRVQRKN